MFQYDFFKDLIHRQIIVIYKWVHVGVWIKIVIFND